MLRQLDLFGNPNDRFYKRTLSGSIMSICCFIVAVSLIASEYSKYNTITKESNLKVNTNTEPTLELNFDITLHNLPCNYLTVDPLTPYNRLDTSLLVKLHKQRLSSTGIPLSEEDIEKEKQEILGNIVPKKLYPNRFNCSSCYGGETEEKPCCPTCKDVWYALKAIGSSFIKADEYFPQCHNEGFSAFLKAQENEGCRITGAVRSMEYGSNFHISPGWSYPAPRDSHYHDLSWFGERHWNLSHTINSVSFGEKYPGQRNPLDGLQRTINETNTFYFYFIKVVSTTYTPANGDIIYSNQYAVTDKVIPHQPELEFLPSKATVYTGIYFFFTVSPIEILINEYVYPFSQFFTGTLAILGGVFTIFKVLDQLVYQGMRHYQKARIGKLL